MKRTPSFPSVYPSVIFSLALLALRMLTTGRLSYWYLAWNISLALLPFWFAIACTKAWPRPRPSVAAWIWGFLWFIFLPNAFYLLTDLIHLPLPPRSTSYTAPSTLTFTYWYDILLVSSFVWAGMLLGILSVRRIHEKLAQLFGDGRAALLVAASLFFSSIGIYIGRIQRFNSWDLLTAPHQVVQYTMDIVTDPTTLSTFLGFTGLLTSFLLLVYFTIFGWQSKENG